MAVSERDLVQKELEKLRRENHKYQLNMTQESALVQELRGAWHEAREELEILKPQREALKMRVRALEQELDAKDSHNISLKEQLAQALHRSDARGELEEST